MTSSLYNNAQWFWLGERREEWYRLKDLADFIGMTERGFANALYHHTDCKRNYKRYNKRLPDLNDRKAEFYALVNVPDESESDSGRYHY